jgi:O-succinylbenzoic acid--CoA ligase
VSVALIAPGVTLRHDDLASHAAATVRVLTAAPTVETFLAIHDALRGGAAIAPIAPDASPAAIAARRAAVDAITPGPEAFALVATSGTSGRPRLVELSRRAAAVHAEASNAHLALAPDDRWLVALPLWHVGGLAAIVRCRAARAAVVFDAPPSLGPHWAEWLCSVVHRHRVTRLSLVPAQVDYLTRERRAAPRELRTVLVGGQALSPTLAAAASALGWPLVASYGLTESFGMCVATRPGEPATSGSVGRPLPGVRVRVVDDRLEVLTPARATAVHGDAPLPRDGWLETADRARLDDDGVTILGRADDVIVTGGHKVDPLEVEAALGALSWVRDAVVFGVVDERFGEVVAAALVADDPPQPGALAARVWEGLADLPRHKRPRRVRVVPQLPRLSNHKLDRRAARALLA